MADNLTSPKGMNNPVMYKVTKDAKNVGMVTDGVSLKEGYKVVTPQGESPQAHTVNDSEKTSS